MHADDFRNDRHGLVTSLRDGGYSDDMTLAAVAGIFCASGFCSLVGVWRSPSVFNLFII